MFIYSIYYKYVTTIDIKPFLCFCQDRGHRVFFQNFEKLQVKDMIL